jgi:TatA/E family protein of Tat protein translocase
MGIGSLGFSEMAIIFVIALIVFGPRKLPELGRSLGTAMREFRRSLNQIQRELEDADPVRTVRDEVRTVRDETRSILGPDPRASSPETPPTRETPPTEPDSESD